MLLHCTVKTSATSGHRSLEAPHKYKRTGPDQQYKVSMALLPQIDEKENKKLCMDDDDD